MRILLLIAVTLSVVAAAPAGERGAGRSRTCGTTDAGASKLSDVEFAGIVPGRGLSAEDFADGGLLIEADPSLALVTDDPIGVLTRAARNWEIPGTMIKFRIAGPGSGGNVVRAENIKQAARATVGRPGWGRNHNLVMTLDEPFSRGDDSLVAVVTHEMGHWLGFDHSFLGSTVMFPVLTDRINWVDPDQVAKAVARYGTAPNSLAEIRGSVTRGGVALVGARVNILGVEGRTAFATFAGTDGAFHVPVYAGTYRIVVDPNDGPAVKGNFIGTYPGGPLDYATYEVPGEVVVSEGQTSVLDLQVPAGGDIGFRIVTDEPTTCGPGAQVQAVAIYYEGANPDEIAGVDSLSDDITITQVTDVGSRMAVFFDVRPLALPGPRAMRLRKTNGAVALLPGAVLIVAPLALDDAAYNTRTEAGAPVNVAWVDNVPRDDTEQIVVSASIDAGATWDEVGRVEPTETTFAWQPDDELTTPALRIRIEAVDSLGTRLARDESIFNTGLGEPARGAAPGSADFESPTVTVVSPAGGETLALDETTRIAWRAGDDTGVTTQVVEFSTDGGARWKTLGTFGSVIREAAWVPDGKSSDAVLVRVTVRDAAGNTVSDTGDAPSRLRMRPAVERVTAKTKGTTITLKIRGAGFEQGASVRVNGVTVLPRVAYSASTATLKVKGTATDLNLLPSGQSNTVTVAIGGLESATATFVY